VPLTVTGGGIIQFTIGGSSNPNIIVVGAVTLNGASIVLELNTLLNEITVFNLITPGAVGTTAKRDSSNYVYNVTTTGTYASQYVFSVNNVNGQLVATVENKNPAQSGAQTQTVSNLNSQGAGNRLSSFLSYWVLKTQQKTSQ